MIYYTCTPTPLSAEDSPRHREREREQAGEHRTLQSVRRQPHPEHLHYDKKVSVQFSHIFCMRASMKVNIWVYLQLQPQALVLVVPREAAALGQGKEELCSDPLRDGAQHRVHAHDREKGEHQRPHERDDHK